MNNLLIPISWILAVLFVRIFVGPVTIWAWIPFWLSLYVVGDRIVKYYKGRSKINTSKGNT
jgi:hypothetical protein